MVINMKKLIVPLIFMMFMLSGCYDEMEPDNIAYVTAVGIDTADDDTYNFTIQFAKTAQISGGASEEGGKGGDIVENIIVQAPSLYTAINWGNHIISKNLSMAHIKLFVFSEEVAKNGVRNITETIVRSQEIRPNIYFAVARDKASEYLINVKPVIEINPAKYYQLLFEQNNYGGIPRNASYDFVLYQNIPEKQNVLPLVGTVKDKSEQKEGSGENGQAGSGDEAQAGGMSEGGEKEGEGDGGGESEKNVKNANQPNAPINENKFEYKSKNYLAGEIGVEVKNKSEAIGMAIFKGDKLVGYMGSTESLIYNILTGDYNTGYLTFKIDGVDIPMTIKAELEEKPHTEYDIDNNSATIKLEIEGDFVSMASEGYTENIIEEFEKQASKEFNDAAEQFLQRTRDEFNSDIIGIGSKTKLLFLTEDEYKSLNWEEKYKTIKFKVDSKFKIRRTGLTARDQ